MREPVAAGPHPRNRDYWRCPPKPWLDLTVGPCLTSSKVGGGHRQSDTKDAMLYYSDKHVSVGVWRLAPLKFQLGC